MIDPAAACPEAVTTWLTPGSFTAEEQALYTYLSCPYNAILHHETRTQPVTYHHT